METMRTENALQHKINTKQKTKNRDLTMSFETHMTHMILWNKNASNQ